METEEDEVQFLMQGGMPQGSILSPSLLWNITFDRVQQLNFPGNVLLIGYANDLALLVSGQERWNKQPSIRWSEESALGFKIKDYSYLLLKLKLWQGWAGKIRQISVSVDGIQVGMMPQVKYLGVWFIQNGLLSKHLQEVVNKSEKAINSPSHLMGSKWGPWSDKHWLLMAAATAVILYAAPTWYEALEKKGNERRLTSLQRRTTIKDFCGL